ncbi:uncharacterized protein LOC141908181 [Tubulanus polymorphus]|uniref:uncharacterized protein LOC141908181 n=1 Tax=Tubulanus polymorphus TaxID=672921 RepID=UPI003DA2583E
MNKFDVTPGKSLRIQKACRVNNFEENRLRKQIILFEKEKSHNIRLTNQNIYTLNRSMAFIRSSSGYSPEGLPPDRETDYQRQTIGSCFLYGDRVISRRFGKFRRATSAGNRHIVSHRVQPDVPTRPQSCPITRNEKFPNWEDVLKKVRTKASEEHTPDNENGAIVVEVPGEIIKIRKNSVNNLIPNTVAKSDDKLTRRISVVRFTNDEDPCKGEITHENQHVNDSGIKSESCTEDAERCRGKIDTRRRSSAKILTRRKSKTNVSPRLSVGEDNSANETVSLNGLSMGNKRKSVVETGEWDSLLKEEKEIFEGPDDDDEDTFSDDMPPKVPLEERRTSRIRRTLPSNDPHKNDFVHTVNQARVLATNVCRRRSSCIPEQFEQIRRPSALDKMVDAKVITLKLELTTQYKEALEKAHEFHISSTPSLKPLHLDEIVDEPKPVSAIA